MTLMESLVEHLFSCLNSYLDDVPQRVLLGSTPAREFSRLVTYLRESLADHDAKLPGVPRGRGRQPGCPEARTPEARTASHA